MRRHRRTARNYHLRVKYRGKLRTRRGLRKILKSKSKAFWRKSRKYHGRTAIHPCYRTRRHKHHAKRHHKKGHRKHKKGRRKMNAFGHFMKAMWKRHRSKLLKMKFGDRGRWLGKEFKKHHRAA